MKYDMHDMEKADGFPRPADVVWGGSAFKGSPDLILMSNRANGWTHKRLCKANRKWIRKVAAELGWDRVYFPLKHPTKNYAGAVFLKLASSADAA